MDIPLPDTLEGAIRWLLGTVLIVAFGFQSVTMLWDRKWLASFCSLLIAVALTLLLVYWSYLPTIILVLGSLLGIALVPTVFYGVVRFIRERRIEKSMLVIAGTFLLVVALIAAIAGGALFYVAKYGPTTPAQSAGGTPQSSASDTAKIAALAQQVDVLTKQLAAANQQSTTPAQQGNSVFGASFIENLELKFSERDPDLVVIAGTAVNAITAEMNVSVDYRTMGLKGTQPMDTPRYAIQSIGKIERTRKGVQVEISVLRKVGSQYVFGDGKNPGLSRGDIGYVRLVIVGPNDEEQRVYFQIVWWLDQQDHVALIYPALTTNWASAWEAAK
jgi:hypothetical protein